MILYWMIIRLVRINLVGLPILFLPFNVRRMLLSFPKAFRSSRFL